MRYLTDTDKIKILMMIRYGDGLRTQAEVAALFHETHPDFPPISQGTISKIEKHYRKMGHVRDVARRRQHTVMDEATQLKVSLALKETSTTPVSTCRRK